MFMHTSSRLAANLARALQCDFVYTADLVLQLSSPKVHCKCSCAADAWKEDSDLGAQLEVVAELFGESVLPWVPFQPGVGLFL